MSQQESPIIGFARNYAFSLWPWYLSGISALAVTNWLTLKIPQFAKDIVNQLSTDSPTEGLQRTALLMVGLGLLQILVRALSRILVFWPGRQIEATLKSDLFSKVNRLPQVFFDRYGMGDLISRLSNDVGHIRALFAFGGLMIVNMIFLLAFVIVQMVSIHQTLALLCLLPMGLTLVLSRFVMPKMHLYSRANQEAVGALTNRVTEAFVNVHTIQAASATDAFIRRTEKENETVFQSNMKLVMLQTFLFPLISALAGISQVVVLFYGGYQVIDGNLTVGDILVFNVYIGYLAFPLTAVGIVMAVYQRAKTALIRLKEIQTAPEEKGEGKEASPSLEVKDLSFAFEKGDPVLQGISFTLPPGKKMGLFGPIGSGKSVLFNLISRIYDPPRGSIFVGGRDVLDWEPRELRRTVGYALQSVHLFSESVAANLRFGAGEGISGEDLTHAAESASVLKEIEKMGQGWETPVGERGVRLSGGQKQRLALARLFLRRPPILLLDDVLSAVDHTTEVKLVRSIDSLSGAQLIASHRIGVLRKCDEILMLDGGNLVDRGSFADLSRRHPELREEESSEAENV